MFPVRRSQEPDDIMRRKIQKNETFLVDELELSQLMTFLLQKKCLTHEDKAEIESERGRKKRGIKLLQKIRKSENREIFGSFIKFLHSISRDDLVKRVQATVKDKGIHKRAGMSCLNEICEAYLFCVNFCNVHNCRQKWFTSNFNLKILVRLQNNKLTKKYDIILMKFTHRKIK